MGRLEDFLQEEDAIMENRRYRNIDKEQKEVNKVMKETGCVAVKVDALTDKELKRDKEQFKQALLKLGVKIIDRKE